MYTVSILWGEEKEPANKEHYTFETETELNAFLAGVEAGNGWMAYEVEYEG
tara:strand:- start:323 stop:475 length:153 start_codon:yes stop_codon:yes gene_type:complete